MSDGSPSGPAAPRAMPNSSPPSPAAMMPTTVSDQHCPLLDLPVEMLQRITNNLHRTEALPALRLTCKALDNITFDRFAQTFEVVNCCIFYEERWLSLKKLLEKPSRITSRIRWVQFTTDFFESAEFDTVPLALNHDDVHLPVALNNTYMTYAESRAAAIQPAPINVALFGRIFLNLERVFPHIGVCCRMSDNQGEGFEHLRAQRDIVFTMVVTHHKIRSLALSHASLSTLDDVVKYMRPELEKSVSKLERFEFVPTRGNEALTTRHNATPYELKVRLMYRVLRSAETLWSLELSLCRFTLLNRASSIMATLLDGTVSNNIRRFVLRSAKLSGKYLLKALSRWAPKLVELELGDVRLTFVREGWSPILQFIATMPKLERLTLWEMGEKRSPTSSDMVVISMNHLSQGRKTVMTARTSTGLRESDRLGRHYIGRDEVLLGLEELLAGRLTYRDAW
jgi:hypothetical protein